MLSVHLVESVLLGPVMVQSLVLDSLVHLHQVRPTDVLVNCNEQMFTGSDSVSMHIANILLFFIIPVPQAEAPIDNDNSMFEGYSSEGN